MSADENDEILVQPIMDIRNFVENGGVSLEKRGGQPSQSQMERAGDSPLAGLLNAPAKVLKQPHTYQHKQDNYNSLLWCARQLGRPMSDVLDAALDEFLPKLKKQLMARGHES